MRKFKIRSPLKITAAVKQKAVAAVQARPPEPLASPPPQPKVDYDKAFPPHLRGTVSGCCDSMADGHG